MKKRAKLIYCKLKSIQRLRIFQFVHLFFDFFFFERGIETARGNPSGIDFSSVQCIDFKVAHVPKFRFKIPADSTIIYTLVKMHLMYLATLYHNERNAKMISCFIEQKRRI